jgi:hypothetical protein
MNRNLAVAFVLIQACLSVPAFSQEPPESITSELRFLIWQNVEGSVWVRTKTELIRIQDLTPYRRSVSIAYTGPLQLPVYAGPPVADAGESPSRIDLSGLDKNPGLLAPYKPLGTVALNPAHKLPLILLIPDAPAVTRMHGTAFEDHPLDFPYGTFKIFNVSTRELFVQLGAKEIVMPPRRITQVDPGKTENGVLDFSLAYRNSLGEWQVAQRSVYRYRLRRREIVFIRESPEEEGRFYTLTVTEMMPPPSPN